MSEKLIIVGTGLSAKQVFDFIKMHNLFDIMGFAIDSAYKKEELYQGLPVFDLENLKEHIDIKTTQIYVALGWNKLNADRRKLYLRLKEDGYSFANLISPLAVIRGTLDGDNIWINDYSVLQSDSKIESNVVIRENVLIGNGSIIEPHCFLGVHSIVGGGARVGQQTFVGMRGTVFDGRRVGQKCLIGACAVVKRHLPDFCACKTASDVMVVKEYGEDEIETKLVAGKSVK